VYVALVPPAILTPSLRHWWDKPKEVSVSILKLTRSPTFKARDTGCRVMTGVTSVESKDAFVTGEKRILNPPSETTSTKSG